MSQRSPIVPALAAATALAASGLLAVHLMRKPVQENRIAPVPPAPPVPAEREEADVPTSERLESVRTRVEPVLARHLTEVGLRFGAPVFLRIFKEEKTLEIWIRDDETRKFVHFRTYPVVNWGRGTLGPKFREGDGQAPEGFYPVAPAQMNPRSDFHLSFNLGFPNAFDRHHGRTGSFLMIHGGEGSIGCYAVTDALVEEIYLMIDGALRAGQPSVPVHCFPFRMTAARLRQAEASPEERAFVAFWRNLKIGYDAFERDRIPPEMVLDPASGRYVLSAPPPAPAQTRPPVAPAGG